MILSFLALNACCSVLIQMLLLWIHSPCPQNFMVMPDPLGITYISDLSAPDMVKVLSVALVELTITFDDHNLPLRPRRATKLKNIPGKECMCVCSMSGVCVCVCSMSGVCVCVCSMSGVCVCCAV